MRTYFVRHTARLDIDIETREQLWKDRRIAIHYPHDRAGHLGATDNSSLEVKDYPPNGRRALKALLALSQSGGYVCAQHHGHEDAQIGFVPAGSPIQLVHGAWGSRRGHQGRPAILKTLQLRKIRLVRPAEHAVILVGRPRQGTIMRWPRARKLIENLVEGRNQVASFEDLSPDQQEVLCSEFLRSDDAMASGLPRLAHLLLPVGRTMKDIDILGIATDYKRIFAQVTFAPLGQVEWKLKRLRAYDSGDGEHFILFCDVARPLTRQGVLVFPIRTAFQSLTAGPIGREWLSAGSRFAR